MSLNLGQGRNRCLDGNAVAGKLNSAANGRLIEMVQGQGQTDVESGIAGRLHRSGDSTQPCIQWRIIGKTHHVLRESSAQQVESKNGATKIGDRGVNRAESHTKHLSRIKASRHAIAHKGQIPRHGLRNRPAFGIGQPHLSDRYIDTKCPFTWLHKWEAVKPPLQPNLDIAGLSALQRRGHPGSQFRT